MKIEKFLEKISREKELKKFFGFSFMGFLAFLFSLFVSCDKNGVKNKDETTTLSPQFNLEKSTTPILTPKPKNTDKDCGPFPGYPCGTKYYTVSLKDFYNYN
jgi:hypothetical protein